MFLLRWSGSLGNVRAWATRAPSGTIHVVLINNDTARSHTVTVRIPGVQGSATLELFAKDTFRQYAAMCGWVLARAHAKAGGLATEVAAWQRRRNAARCGIEWTFTRRDADRKLSRHYVS